MLKKNNLEIITSLHDQKKYSDSARSRNEKILFIPTMGNLHLGHESLIREAQKFTGKIVISIFVNPLQFNSSIDYDNYPSTSFEDMAILSKYNIDLLFMPNKKEILDELESLEKIKLPKYMSILCGEHRNGHFEGVFAIINKLFNIIQPSFVYFGRKDYQQLLLIKHIVAEKFDNKINIIDCETIREANGLAISSRNIGLNQEQKKQAAQVQQYLQLFKKQFKAHKYRSHEIEGKWLIFKKRCLSDLLENYGIKIEYLELLTADKLDNLYSNGSNLMIFVAFYVSSRSDIRLIDNIDI